MDRMNFAPLRYVLAIARFSPILAMEGHVAAFQERIRRNYDQVDEQLSQGIVTEMGPEGVRIRPVTGKMWQFSDAQRQHALILAPDFMLLHAGQAYEGHCKFFDRFATLLTGMAETPGLGVTHVNALGFRVVNLIESQVGVEEDIGSYLRPWALPPAAPDFSEDKLEALDGACIASFRTSHGVLRFQVLRKPGGAFPPDLDNPFVRANGWIENIKADDYIFLDTDHFAVSTPPAPLDPVELRAKFEAMHSAVRTIFEAAVTPRALEQWSRPK